MQNTDNFLLDGDWSSYLSFPNEQLLVVARRHRLMAAIPLFFISLFTPLLLASTWLLAMFLHMIPLFIILSLTEFAVITTLIAKIIIEWYFHLYIITNRKILEVSYAPLSSRVINGVLLDQVRCTEIDIQTSGMVRHVLDMGDINITFDRPTRRDSFTLSEIKNPRKIGSYLSYVLVNSYGNISHVERPKFVWFKQKEDKQELRFAEEIFPGLAPNST